MHRVRSKLLYFTNTIEYGLFCCSMLLASGSLGSMKTPRLSLRVLMHKAASATYNFLSSLPTGRKQ